ncbi:PHP domain-containing protein [Haloarchaeobius amylolyticus]|uniref:PHP domain-containing protein n=1 Tax=Haloarchaeobius amylolyticus TaxID=1198296 RepID=UPI002270B45A|nr:PHP domain-containing protein [Haloarchaeobius amylolyticus]
MRDLHVHSTYSDGSFLTRMVHAAQEAGLEGVGIADHCNVSAREDPQTFRATYGFNLDVTYERRRLGIETVREKADITIYDAVEMDYDPRDEAEIRAFLDEADFDYVIGSVHTVGEYNVQAAPQFADLSDAELDAVVDDYFDALVALADSELFDIAAHPDLIERTEPLRGRATVEHYERATRAFAESRTVPEINAGRALGDPGFVHPDPEFLAALQEYDVAVTVGTDSHRPDEIGERAAFLDRFLDDHGIEPVEPSKLVD